MATRRLGNGQVVEMAVAAFIQMFFSGRSFAWAAAHGPGGSPLGNPVGAVVGLLVALGLILVLIVLTIRFLSSRSQVDARGGIRVLAARQIAPNRSVQVISVGHREFLIGVGEQISLLAEVSDTDLSAVSMNTPSPLPLGQAFAAALRQSRQQFGKLEEGNPTPGVSQEIEGRAENHEP